MSVMGFRIWKRTLDGYLISPVEKAVKWGNGIHEAECAGYTTYSGARALRACTCLIYKPHTSPLMGCRCGFYAFATPELCYKKTGSLQRNDDLYVFGVIEMAGHMIEHQGGYRSQYARIRGVFTRKRLHPMYTFHRHSSFQELADTWRVPGDVPVVNACITGRTEIE